MTNPKNTHLLFWSTLLVLTFATTAAVAQRRPRMQVPPPDLICLDELDAHATQPVVRALINDEANIIVDQQTNCLLIVGANDLTETRRILAQLELRVVLWQHTQRQRPRARTPRRPPTRPRG
jgi:hypothetical protein